MMNAKGTPWTVAVVGNVVMLARFDTMFEMCKHVLLKMKLEPFSKFLEAKSDQLKI